MKTTKRNRILNGSKLLNKLYKLIHIPETRLTASYSATDDVCIVTNIYIVMIKDTMDRRFQYLVKPMSEFLGTHSIHFEILLRLKSLHSNLFIKLNHGIRIHFLFDYSLILFE